jgi:hypothetical protein
MIKAREQEVKTTIQQISSLFIKKMGLLASSWSRS